MLSDLLTEYSVILSALVIFPFIGWAVDRELPEWETWKKAAVLALCGIVFVAIEPIRAVAAYIVVEYFVVRIYVLAVVLILVVLVVAGSLIGYLIDRWKSGWATWKKASVIKVFGFTFLLA